MNRMLFLGIAIFLAVVGIALIGGDTDERTHLQELLRGVRRGWERQTYGLVRIIVFTTAYGVLANPFPLLVAAPRYILGFITLGTLMQMAQAFSQVTAALAARLPPAS